MPTAPDGAPASSVWAVSVGLFVLSNTGASFTALTVIVATTVLPPRPASPLEVEAWTVKLPPPLKSAVGVNFSPAFASANVMNVPLVICVVPSFLYSVPLLIPVILKCVTSAPVGDVARDHQPTGRLRVLVGRGVGHRRRVGHRVDHQTGGVGGRGEGRRAAVAVGVGHVPLLPLVWSQARKVIAAGQRAVVVGVGLEVEPRVGIGRQQPGVVTGDRPQRVPVCPAVCGVVPTPVGITPQTVAQTGTRGTVAGATLGLGSGRQHAALLPARCQLLWRGQRLTFQGPRPAAAIAVRGAPTATAARTGQHGHRHGHCGDQPGWHTPSVANTTTNEDTQTTSGLVISRNVADGVEVTYFKSRASPTAVCTRTTARRRLPAARSSRSLEGGAGLLARPRRFSGNGSFTIQASLPTATPAWAADRRRRLHYGQCGR